VQGRQVYYRANEQCPVFNELKSIVRKTFGVPDVLRQSLGTGATKVRLAFIFGSVARSADDRRSDIDLMVVGKISLIQTFSPEDFIVTFLSQPLPFSKYLSCAAW